MKYVHMYVMHYILIFSGLFESDKLLFSFNMATKIQEAESKLNRDELDFFIKGNISLEKSSHIKPFDWLPDQGWEDLMKLVVVSPDQFASLPEDMEKNEESWKEVILLVNNYPI